MSSIIRMSRYNTNITSIEKVLTNIDYVRQICKFLKYKDQFKLRNVSYVLDKIITNFIWKNVFEEVELRICNRNNFLVRNKIYGEEEIEENLIRYNFNLFSTNAIHLTKIEMEMFFNLNRNNIQKLKIATMGQRKLFQGKLLLRGKFENLKYISFWNFCLIDQHLRYIADNCKNVETLVLSKCVNSSVLVEDNSLEILETLQNLRNLKITQRSLSAHLFHNIEKLLNRLKLQKLILYRGIYFNNTIQLELYSHKLKDYKDFQIGHIRNNNSFHFLKNILTNFENLNNLLLTKETITEDFFNILLQSCGNLKQLSLIECEINNFTALPKLQKISLYRCGGLTYRDLEIIMNEMNLKSFSATITNFGNGNNIDTFPVSPTLQHFQMEHNNGFTKINTELVKLRKLYLNILNRKQISLEFAPNLKYLYTNIKIENFFQLKYLQKVVLNRFYSDEMEQLIQLLKHKNLKELSLLHYKNNSRNLRGTEAVTTNLLYFNTIYSMMEHEQSFVLDLLNANPKLSLKCSLLSNIIANASLMRRILLNEKFPKRFKSINVCGLAVDCATILARSREPFEIMGLFDKDYYFVLQ